MHPAHILIDVLQTGCRARLLSQDESGRNGIFEIAFEITWVTTSARTVFFLLYFW